MLQMHLMPKCILAYIFQRTHQQLIAAIGKHSAGAMGCLLQTVSTAQGGVLKVNSGKAGDVECSVCAQAHMVQICTRA